MMVVQNISGKVIKIAELGLIIKPGYDYIEIPYTVAKKYKRYLKPIKMSDTTMNNKVKAKNEESKQTKEFIDDSLSNEKLVEEVVVPEVFEDVSKDEPVVDDSKEVDEDRTLFEEEKTEGEDDVVKHVDKPNNKKKSSKKNKRK
jgi:hypothetical protein